jgi:hypothetical protein
MTKYMFTNPQNERSNKVRLEEKTNIDVNGRFSDFPMKASSNGAWLPIEEKLDWLPLMMSTDSNGLSGSVNRLLYLCLSTNWATEKVILRFWTFKCVGAISSEINGRQGDQIKVRQLAQNVAQTIFSQNFYSGKRWPKNLGDFWNKKYTLKVNNRPQYAQNRPIWDRCYDF